MAIASVTVVTDVPGRLLTGIAAVGLILFAGVTWRARPKLAITDAGLMLRGWFRTQLLRPADIKIIRITEFRRYGRKLRLLEVETADDGLVLFSRWDLGVDPLEVLDALTAAGYAGRQPS
jgi:Bacterial PH domain